MRTFEISSDLAAPPETVWQRVVTPEGINDEFVPLMRMTMPRRLRDTTIDGLPLGQRVGRSWLLLFGLIPVDYDDLALAEVEPGRRFLEQSTMLTHSRWQHERIVEPRGVGCRLSDRLAWQGRAEVFEMLYGVAVPILFRNRHRRLRKRFGAAISAR
ncbi:MAG: hypothetical protein ACM4D3_04045 [Candidatus Sericytochromatia bacterium]